MNYMKHRLARKFSTKTFDVMITTDKLTVNYILNIFFIFFYIVNVCQCIILYFIYTI